MAESPCNRQIPRVCWKRLVEGAACYGAGARWIRPKPRRLFWGISGEGHWGAIPWKHPRNRDAHGPGPRLGHIEPIEINHIPKRHFLAVPVGHTLEILFNDIPGMGPA